MFKGLTKAALALFATALLASPAFADLDDIIASGKIRIATNVGAAPWGMMDANNQPYGGDIEMAKKIAADLGVEYELVSTTGANRVPYLVTDQADLVISIFAITPERAKAVAFTDPYAYVDGVLIGGPNVNIATAEDMRNYRIGVVRGNTQEGHITRLVPGMDFIRFDDDASLTAALLAGQVDAVGTSDAIMAATNAANASLQLGIKLTFDRNYFAIGVARNNPDLLRWADTWVFFNKQNGWLGQNYETTMGRPMDVLPTF